jgi:hypothetical protein
MIQFTEHHQIDKAKWDACIMQSEHGMVYASSWYLDIVSPGWHALVMDDYNSVFPLTWRKKYGIHYLFQPNFTQQLGVYSTQKIDSPELIQSFINSIPDKFRLIEIQLNHANTFPLENIKSAERLTHHLNLSLPFEKIQQQYSENLVRNIKRTDKNKLEISSSIKFIDIIRLFQKNRGKEINTLTENDYKVLSKLLVEANHRRLITAIGAKTPAGNWCAGAVFLKSFHEYIFLFSGTDIVGRNSGAMSSIIDHFIESHAAENTILDFEGSMDKNLARFYKSFGSKEIVYLQIRKNNLPVYLKWIKR